jgi:2-dehydro-3-deoxygluconokinase
MTELVTFGETALRLTPPGEGRLAQADQLDVQVAGAESNVAVAAGQLGADATWVSKVADSALGRRAVAELRGCGIGTEVVWDPDGTQSLVFHESPVAPREGVTIEDHRGTPIAGTSPGELPMDTIQDAGMVFVSSTTPALSDGAMQTAEAVLRAGVGSGSTTALSLEYREALWDSPEDSERLTRLFDPVDILISTPADIETVLGETGEPPELAHKVASAHDFEAVVISRGRKGALAWHDATIHETTAIDAETVDESGALDALTGGFLARYLAEESPARVNIADALAHGTALATLARTVPGPLLSVTAAEVQHVLDQQE